MTDEDNDIELLLLLLLLLLLMTDIGLWRRRPMTSIIETNDQYCIDSINIEMTDYCWMTIINDSIMTIQTDNDNVIEDYWNDNGLLLLLFIINV